MKNIWWILLAIIVLVGIFAVGIILGRSYIPSRPASSSVSSSVSSSSSSSVSSSSSSSVASSSSPATANLTVYFHKNPDSDNDFTAVFPTLRSTDRTDVGTFVIEQYLAGPTSSEAATGLYNTNKLTGTSNCSSRDFTLSVATGKATLRLCRVFASAGVGDDARFSSAVNKMLKQFSTVQSVVILTQDGNCFGDLSGENRCLTE